MALYAFDGTWNESQEGVEADTNVAWFHAAYQGGRHYYKGIGTRGGRVGAKGGGLTGAGGRRRIREALKALGKNFDLGDRVIDVVGFSRGAALALHFANQIFQKDIPGHPGSAGAAIRFIGLWDTVPSFGNPLNDKNIGWDLDLPDNVQKCYHALALDERRRGFGLYRPDARVSDANQEGRLFELWFRGVHSDVGGGNANRGLSSIALHWILVNAAACGLPLDQAAVDQARNRKTADSPISLHRRTSLNGSLRVVRWNDRVHDSVTFRPDDGRRRHNNPPLNLTRINDSGRNVGKFRH